MSSPPPLKWQSSECFCLEDDSSVIVSAKTVGFITHFDVGWFGTPGIPEGDARRIAQKFADVLHEYAKTREKDDDHE